MNRNFTALCAALLMCAIMIVFYGSALLGKSGVSFAEDAPPKNVIYLTFDDGPSNRVTPKILDILKKEKVKATFFIVGKSAESRGEIIKREIAEGHTVGLHSYSHDYKKIYASPKALSEDIERCNAILEKITGSRSNLYRFPGGSFNLSERLKTSVKNNGYRYVDWNASFCDGDISNPDAYTLYKSAINTVAYPEHIIMLAHDSTDKSATAEALGDVIKYFKQKNYVFAAL